MKEAIASVEVKHNARIKIPKFTLQIYAFVYQRLMNFPTAQFSNFPHHTESVRVSSTNYQCKNTFASFSRNWQKSGICTQFLQYASEGKQPNAVFFYCPHFPTRRNSNLSVANARFKYRWQWVSNISFASLGSQVKFC